MPHQLRRHAPAPHPQVPARFQHPHVVRRRAERRFARRDVVEQTLCCGASERVAECAERGDGGVQEAGLRRDVEGGEEGGCFGGEVGGRWEGGVGVGEGGVRVGCGGEGVVAGAEPEDVPGCWRGPVGLGGGRWRAEV